MEKIEILKITSDKEEEISDVVSEEIPLTIYADDTEIVTLLASPSDISELAVGFMWTSGLITKFNDISGITIDDKNWAVYLKLRDTQIDSSLLFKRMWTSGCGRGTLFYNAIDIIPRKNCSEVITISRDTLFSIMKNFQHSSLEFKNTGGIHSAALADTKNILVIKEDIGRHNAIDKIIGYGLMNNIELKDKIILSSGRISSEIIFKIEKTDISVIISRSAPTNQAVRHARRIGFTLVGFVRGERMNIYSGKDRIL